MLDVRRSDSQLVIYQRNQLVSVINTGTSERNLRHSGRETSLLRGQGEETLSTWLPRPSCFPAIKPGADAAGQVSEDVSSESGSGLKTHWVISLQRYWDVFVFAGLR